MRIPFTRYEIKFKENDDEYSKSVAWGHEAFLPSLLACGAAIGIFYSVACSNAQQDQNDKRIIEQSTIKADTNRDGVTTREEWRAVYSKIGVQYDELHPRALSTSDLEKFLKVQ